MFVLWPKCWSKNKQAVINDTVYIAHMLQLYLDQSATTLKLDTGSNVDSHDMQKCNTHFSSFHRTIRERVCIMYALEDRRVCHALRASETESGADEQHVKLTLQWILSMWQRASAWAQHPQELCPFSSTVVVLWLPLLDKACHCIRRLIKHTILSARD